MLMLPATADGTAAASWQLATGFAAGGICMSADTPATAGCAQQGMTAAVSASPPSSRAAISTNWSSFRMVFFYQTLGWRCSSHIS